MEDDISSTGPSSQATTELERLEREPTQGLARTFSALRHRNYRLFWIGQLISLIGTWMQTVAQSWLVLQLTDSALLLGLVGALQFFPVLLFALFGGVVADRFPKRNLLVVTQTTAMILAFILAVLTSTGLVQIWHVMILAALLGLVNALDMPTRQAFMVEMVGKEDLMNAIALNSSIFNGARIVGPAVAGLLIGWLGIAVCFYLNAASYLAVIGGLLAMRIKPQAKPSSTRDSVWLNLREGLGYIRRTHIVLLVILQIGIFSTFGMNFNVVIPVFARDVLGSDATGYGILMSAIGIGALVGALGLAYLGKAPTLGVMLASGFVFGAFQIALAGTQWLPLSALLLVFVGFAFLSFAATGNTLIQTNSPDGLRGRVMSVYTLVFAGSTPAGNLMAGAVAHTFGPVSPLILGGAVCVVAALIGWRFLMPRQETA